VTRRSPRFADEAVVDRDRREGEAVDDPFLRCATCGRALDGDPDEDPTGDAGRPICGECARENDFLTLDMLDGEIDGEIDGDWDSDR
jgi:hypothetical protein